MALTFKSDSSSLTVIAFNPFRMMVGPIFDKPCLYLFKATLALPGMVTFMSSSSYCKAMCNKRKETRDMEIRILSGIMANIFDEG